MLTRRSSLVSRHLVLRLMRSTSSDSERGGGGIQRGRATEDLFQVQPYGFFFLYDPTHTHLPHICCFHHLKTGNGIVLSYRFSIISILPTRNLRNHYMYFNFNLNLIYSLELERIIKSQENSRNNN